jgi:hypothetical protein
MPINLALLKYGYSKFSVEILEYCDIKDSMLKEKHYFDLFNPEYNILEFPGSPSKGKGWKHSEATIEKMILAARNKSTIVYDTISKSQSHSIPIEVYDHNTKITTNFHAIRAAAKALGIDKRYIENFIYLKQTKPVLDRYEFKLLNEPNNDTSKISSSSSQKFSQEIEVLDVETKAKTIYPSVTAAGKSLGIRQASISLYLKENRKKPFKGKYFFKLIVD